MAQLEAEFDDALRGPSAVTWLVCATVLCFVVWAKFAWIDEIVRAPGEVVSASRPQIIQNLEGGILADLLVAEGDIVQEGDTLARLEGTQFITTVADLEEQLIAAEIRRLRLEAEIEGVLDFSIPREYAERSPQIVTSELALLQARLSDFRSRKEGASRVLQEVQRELVQMEDMFEREIVALVEVTEKRKAFADAEIKLNEIVTGTELARAAELSETLQRLATLRQDLRLARDQLSRTVISAPMRGIVNNLEVTTIGGVIRPGQEIFQIIPLDDALSVEARVKPSDIANIVPGQRATVKLSAYDYTIHGSLDAVVRFISADTFKNEDSADEASHYRVTLEVVPDPNDPRQQGITLRPGLLATVELHTGAKTVLQYLTKPLYRGSEALQEP